MSNLGRRHRAWLLPLAVAACSASPAPAPPPPPVQIAPVASCAPGATAAGCEGAAPEPAVKPAPCLNGPAGPRCDGLVDRREADALPGDIKAAREAMISSGFADVRAVARLARLTLRRDGDGADSDGKDDAARALRWAQTAIAVDHASPEARLVLALALARSLQPVRAVADPAVREPALALVEIALRAVQPGAAGRLGAVARTTEGYLAIERGQPAQANAAFEAATRLDPDLGTAWVGLGDVARGAWDFGAATAAYEHARSRLPDDAGIARALQAVERKEPLALPAPSTAPPPMATGPVAPVPPLPKCSLKELKTPAAANLCQGLERIAHASSRADHEAGAKLVLEGWKAMLALCDAKDTACGPTVLQAMGAGSRAFRAAGAVAKAIAVAKIVLDPRHDYPGAGAIRPQMELEIGDHYFSLGVFEEAAAWYARHVRQAGAKPGAPAVAAADRALRLYVAIGNGGSATSLAEELARNNGYPAAQRAGWLVAAAAALRAVKGHEMAAAWLQGHQPLLDGAGATAAAAEVSKPLPAAPAQAVVCAAPLTCAVRRLAGEAW